MVNWKNSKRLIGKPVELLILDHCIGDDVHDPMLIRVVGYIIKITKRSVTVCSWDPEDQNEAAREFNREKFILVKSCIIEINLLKPTKH